MSKKNQLGTADAINSAKGIFNNYKGNLLILYGDMPLIKKESIKTIINCTDNNFNLVGFHSNNPKGYGTSEVAISNAHTMASTTVDDTNQNYVSSLESESLAQI